MNQVNANYIKDSIAGFYTDPGSATPLKIGMLKSMKERGGELSYDECITLAKDARDTAKACGPFDPAYQPFVAFELNMLKYASLLNDVECLGRHDHQVKAEVLLEVLGETVEVDIWLNRDGAEAHNPNMAVGHFLNRHLVNVGLASVRLSKMDFCILNEQQIKESTK
jgi:hypothetical protein